MSLQAPLWRSIAVFRFASLAYAAILLAIRPIYYAHWGWAWVVLAAMTAWTIASTIAYSVPARRTRLLLAADLIVTVLALLSTALLQTPRRDPDRGHAGHRHLARRAGPGLGRRRRGPGRARWPPS